MGSTGSWPINPFDAAVYVCLAVAVIAGFNSGLLRSLATIFGYVCAAPVAVAAMPYLTPYLADQLKLSTAQNWPVFFVVFLLAGLVLGALLRLAVGELTGPTVSAPDRAAGAMLGAVRIALLAVLMVAIFDRVIPPGREPAFLKGSQLRPILSAAAQQGLQSLPPDVVDYIDRLKRARGI
jgi:membrane protein required for colicin V production